MICAAFNKSHGVRVMIRAAFNKSHGVRIIINAVFIKPHDVRVIINAVFIKPHDVRIIINAVFIKPHDVRVIINAVFIKPHGVRVMILPLKRRGAGAEAHAAALLCKFQADHRSFSTYQLPPRGGALGRVIPPRKMPHFVSHFRVYICTH